MTNTIHPNELRAQPIRNLLPRLFRDISSLVRQEADLARDEVAQKSGIAAKVALSATFFAAFAAMALIALTACIVAALGMTMALWEALLIVGAVYAVAAIAFWMSTTAQLRQAGGLLPPRMKKYFSVPPPTEEKLQYDQRGVEAAWDRVERDVAALSNKNDIAGPMRDAVLALGSLSIAIGAALKSEQSRN